MVSHPNDKNKDVFRMGRPLVVLGMPLKKNNYKNNRGSFDYAALRSAQENSARGASAALYP